jgi:3-methyladenine DNA glycosylase Mpg
MLEHTHLFSANRLWSRKQRAQENSLAAEPSRLCLAIAMTMNAQWCSYFRVQFIVYNDYRCA